ncbi:ECF RNA polymerase sigma-E factor [Stieleria maiorica]|uniref:RNA polymerase sigma factor n=1 Tax=Stieleria maiorica TaxID=2795974 RepID=A0A5B9MBF6_9BACT|nr:sigma-70 family RNA polymerase sigma factor [Stieleria maiorica]QEF96894.1 ECF RNA polymerase sigma-E factor [Stieleria maiorica]
MNPEVSEEIHRCVQAVVDGDRSSFRRVVEIMLPVIRAYVAARSLPGVDVDEIVQRTFVEAYKSIGKYRAGSDLQAWLVTIARFQTMMEVTRLRRQADYHSRYIPVALARQMESQLACDATEDERLTFLRECLGQIKESSRELIHRRYAEDLSMEDIAATMKRTAGAVRKELCLVRKRLHECIEHKTSLTREVGGEQ